MRKLYVYLYVILILIAIPVYASRYFFYRFDSDYELVPVFCGTHSMSPTFECNDTLILTAPKVVRVGDVIAFTPSKELKDWLTNTFGKDKVRYIVHRVIRKDHKNCYVTKGDAINIEDEFHPCFYDIKGVVKGVIYE